MQRPNIIVIGAGMSGLGAARTLQDAGATVTVLEGRSRVGGRVWTDRSLGFPNDLGASWIHGPVPFKTTFQSPKTGSEPAPSMAVLQEMAAQAKWTQTPNPDFDPTVANKPWNPICLLAYAAGLPLVRTSFGSTTVYNSKGVPQTDQGDAYVWGGAQCWLLRDFSCNRVVECNIGVQADGVCPVEHEHVSQGDENHQPRVAEPAQLLGPLVLHL